MTPSAGGERVPSVAVFAPALVLLVELERDVRGAAEVHLHPGGQGYWVARMAAVLGARALLCAPIGGESGDVVRHLLDGEPIELRAVPMSSENGVYIHDRREGERRALLEAEAPVLGRHDLDQLYNVTLASALEAGVCVVAGTQLRQVVPERTYERLVTDLVATGVRVVVDLAGPLLKAALAGHPDVVKISHEELVADGWAPDDSVAGIAAGISALSDAGARDVVVSHADAATIASVGDELVVVDGPKLCVVEHRGAGDSMTAGLAVGAALGLGRRESLALATAAGAVTVTRHGLASGHAETIRLLAQRVRVTTLDPRG